jgi:hypothetical protein
LAEGGYKGRRGEAENEQKCRRMNLRRKMEGEGEGYSESKIKKY